MWVRPKSEANTGVRLIGVVGLMLALLASACGVTMQYEEATAGVDGDEVTDDFSAGGPEAGTEGSSSSTPTTLRPPDDVKIVNDTGSDINRIAANAIRDLEGFWASTYPAVFGEPYEPIAGGYFSINRNTRPSTLPCGPTNINQVLNNAYYCGFTDAIAWDEEFLMPDLAAEYGDFTVAVVLAHEWGHAIQERRAMDEPTVVLELQADCYAGAWVQHVVSSEHSRFEVSTRQLDEALAGVLSLRDALGGDADDPNAHGSGFDRVSAFQSGFEEGAGRCKDFRVGDPTPYLFPFDENDPDAFATQGDMDYVDITTEAFKSLEGYWADIFPALSGGTPWEPLEPARPFTTAEPPVCNGQTVTQYRLFLCVPDRYVGYDDEDTMPRAYEFGDFAVAALFGTQYGLEVQDQLKRPPGDEITATIRADCYTGAWAAALLPQSQTDPAAADRYVVRLSPGDLDEAVRVLLSFRTESDRERQGPGFARVRSFRTGVLNGPGACVELTA